MKLFKMKTANFHIFLDATWTFTPDTPPLGLSAVQYLMLKLTLKFNIKS